MNRFIIFLLVLLSVPLTASAQWSWPEQSDNLQVLPADFSGQRLRAVMTGFTRSLGVRCSHCHVGEEGQPLSSYDFASDENPKKNVARAMLGMLGDVNDRLRTLDIDEGKRVNMWCHTCHRGAARPQTLEEALLEARADGGTESMLARYQALRDRYFGRGTYDFSEQSLNGIGYTLLGEDDYAAAIAVFRLITEQNPESANAFDSLAEAYAAAGQPELAVIFYEKSLSLDPDNPNAIEQIRLLRRQ